MDKHPGTLKNVFYSLCHLYTYCVHYILDLIIIVKKLFFFFLIVSVYSLLIICRSLVNHSISKTKPKTVYTNFISTNNFLYLFLLIYCSLIRLVIFLNPELQLHTFTSFNLEGAKMCRCWCRSKRCVLR